MNTGKYMYVLIGIWRKGQFVMFERIKNMMNQLIEV